MSIEAQEYYMKSTGEGWEQKKKKKKKKKK
jgi:hypothetical protein